MSSSDKSAVGEKIAAGAVQQQESATAVGQPVVVAERGVGALAPSYVPDGKAEDKDGRYRH